MKKSLTFILLICLSLLSTAQVQWVRDFKLAQAMALSNDKFIVMDFWASWCGPCRKMDSDMWDTEQINTYADKFIFLKIDVDINPTLARGYQATTIPKVIIMDPTGQPIWERVGYGGADPYMDAFKKFEVSSLPITDFTSVIQDKNVASAKFNIGLWYQQLGTDSETTFAADFIKISDSYLKDAAKSENASLALEAEFNLILNYAYKGNVKKALKKVEKMDETDMKNFILAYCYKCEGQTELMKKFSEKIESEDLMARLDQ